MKKILLYIILFFTAISSSYAKSPPLRAVLFHKNIQKGASSDKYYLHGMIVGKIDQSATIRTTASTYASCKEGDTILLKYNWVFDSYKLEGVTQASKEVNVQQPKTPQQPQEQPQKKETITIKRK
jgi:hypothetical protein